MFKSLKFRIVFISLTGVVALLITVLTYVLPLYETQVRDGLKHEVKAAVDIANTLIEHYWQLSESKQLTKEQAQEMAKAAIRRLRYNETDYFFVYAFNGDCLAHGLNAAREGKNMLEDRDPNGVPYQRQMRDLAQSPEGSGYSSYSFPKVKDGPAIPKLSYVRGFKAWEWYFGSGVYEDVVQEKIAAFRISIFCVFGFITLVVLGLALGFSISISKKISHIVEALSLSSEDVGRSIHTVSEAGKSLADSSTSAAASLQETVASLEEVTSVITQNSTHAQSASNLSQNSKGTAEVGEQQMRNLMQSMNEISSYSHKIEEIINVIDDIAFQTNLLALNAAVEAARAGEQGRGFAVVAEAVRTLALKSSDAAKDINSLIRESVDKVESGQKIADQSSKVLGDILNSVNQVADLNAQIANGGGEQSQGIQMIGQSMNQLDSVIQANAASTEEISSNVVEIADRMRTVGKEVESLKRLVNG